MLFICLNADIAGQFEFIQHNWLNNGRFSGLYGETDPVLNYPGEDRSAHDPAAAYKRAGR